MNKIEEIAECFGEKTAEISIKMLHAKECRAGVYPVILHSGICGILFHEACGHSLEATNVLNNTTEFSNKMGKQIANSNVTLVDNGRAKQGWGSSKIDDEGTRTRENILIREGVLQSYLTDRRSAEILKVPRTGNARRENYTYMPTARMTNTYLVGNEKEENLFQDVREGVYVVSVGGGSVNTVTGEFNFSVNEGYWITQGEIAYPVRGASIIGQGSEVLNNIEKVSGNSKLELGMCIAKSGKIPVGIGQPKIKVSKMIIGGTRM